MRSRLNRKAGELEKPENPKNRCSANRFVKTFRIAVLLVKTFKIAAPARQNLENRCSGSTVPSKSLLRLDSAFGIAAPARLCLRKHCSGSSKPSKSLFRLDCAFEMTSPARLCLRNHYSGSTMPSKSLLRLDCAFGNYCSSSTVPSKSLLRLDCASKIIAPARLCLRNRSASNCALLRALLCSTSQAP